MLLLKEKFIKSLVAVSTRNSATRFSVADSGVATLELSSPKRANVLDRELMRSLQENIADIRQQECNLIILKSSQDGVFCAGMDLAEFYNRSDNDIRDYADLIADFWQDTYLCPLPIIALINGSAIAGGCVLAACCDYRIMVDNPKYRIGVPDTKFGVYPPQHFISVLANLMGTREAERSLQIGKLYNGREALKVGLIGLGSKNIYLFRHFSSRKCCIFKTWYR